MTREIKFRAWDESAKEMHYPEDKRHDTVKTASAHILKHHDCVMQFTGLKDKNGKEIYEGDILLDDNYPEDGISYAKVFWDERPHHIGWANDWGIDIDSFDFKVVGNIYENPNLLSS